MRRVFFIIIIFIFFISCSKHDLNNFQNHELNPDYTLFGLLDEFPALKSAFQNLDQTRFNRKLSEPLNKNIEASEDIIALLPDLLSSVNTLYGSESVLTDVIAEIREMLYLIIHQDELDDSATEVWADSFFSLYEKLLLADVDFSDDLVKILKKSIDYIYDQYEGDDLENIVDDLLDLLEDKDGVQNLDTLLTEFSMGIGKLLLQANRNMYLEQMSEDTYRLVDLSENLDEIEEIDTKLGNSVLGVDLLFSGINNILKDPSLQEVVFNMLRSTGDLFADIRTTDVLKTTMINIEKYFVEGGEQFKDDYDKRNSTEEYINADLVNALKELWPAIQQLFISRGKKGSILNDQFDKGPESFVELLSKKLNFLDLDLESVNIEESLARMVRLDGRGRDRINPEKDASNLNFLDSLLYVFMAATHVGFQDSWDSEQDDIRKYTSKSDGYNFGHMHGKPTGGILTLNDCFYSLGTLGMFEITIPFTTGPVVNAINLYTMALGSPPLGFSSLEINNEDYGPRGDKIFRSSHKFTSAEAESDSSYRFYFSPSYPVLGLLSSHVVGDAGLPNGGQGLGEEGGYKKFITFYPKSPDGLGEFNTARWTMGLIARTCWEGEGPYYYADPKASTVTFEHQQQEKNWSIYYRPNGKVYALVYKDPNSPYKAEEWEYLYPAVENDPVDTLGNYDPDYYEDDPPPENIPDLGLDDFSGLERANRYKEKWHTDYFMIENHDEFYSTGDVNQYWVPGLASSQTEANCYWLEEKIKEKDDSRECASQEEAIYKNFQWLLYEKKLAFVLPLRINFRKKFLESIDLTQLELAVTAFATIECNGLIGLANLHKTPPDYYGLQSGNKRWLINKGSGDSDIPGDVRLSIDLKKGLVYPAVLNADLIYQMFLNPAENAKIIGIDLLGYLMPDILGANLNPMSGLGILRELDINEKEGYLKGISSAEVKRTDGQKDYWEERNRILPLLVTFLGILHEESYYEKPEAPNDYDYNRTGDHFYPLKIVTDSLLPPLANPMFFYKKFNGVDVYQKDQIECWQPRLKGNNYYLKKQQERYNPNYYEPKENRTPLGILSESDFKKNDGLIPLLSRVDLVTQMLKFFQFLGSSTFDSVNYNEEDSSTWGGRRKVFFGLEQIFTTIKTSKGTGLTDNEVEGFYQREIYNYENWMFSDNYKRPEDLDLETILNEVIGSRLSYKGLASFVYNRSETKKEDCYNVYGFCLDQCEGSDEECHSSCLENYNFCLDQCYDWDNFDRVIWGLGELLSNQGFSEGKYNLVENLINFIDKILNKIEPTDLELSALRHTLGILFSKYDQEEGWIYQEEVKNILTEHLPNFIRVFDDNYSSLFLLGGFLAEDDSFFEYFCQNLHSDFSALVTAEQWYDFLGTNLVENPNSELWEDLIEIIEGAIGIMEDENPAWYESEFQNNGVW